MASVPIIAQCFVMRLCYSRRIFAMAFPAQKQAAFFLEKWTAVTVPGAINWANLSARIISLWKVLIGTITVLRCGGGDVIFSTSDASLAQARLCMHDLLFVSPGGRAVGLQQVIHIGDYYIVHALQSELEQRARVLVEQLRPP